MTKMILLSYELGKKFVNLHRALACEVSLSQRCTWLQTSGTGISYVYRLNEDLLCNFMRTQTNC